MIRRLVVLTLLVGGAVLLEPLRVPTDTRTSLRALLNAKPAFPCALGEPRRALSVCASPGLSDSTSISALSG